MNPNLQVQEKDLILPAVMLLSRAEGKKATASELKDGLAKAFGLRNPSPRFSRAVYNLKSHRTLERYGLASVVGKDARLYKVSKKGQDLVALAGLTTPAALEAARSVA